MILTVDGLTLQHGDDFEPTVDDDGVEWIADKLDGWWGSPAPRTARTPRPTGIGSHRAPSWRGERIVTVEGVLTAPDRATMFAAATRVSSICQDPDRLYELLVTDETGAWTATVELDGAVLTEQRTWQSRRFSFQLAAPDPRLHSSMWQSPGTGTPDPPVGALDFSAPGVDWSAPGADFGTAGTARRAEVYNTGTATAYPVFDIAGPAPAPRILDEAAGITLAYAGVLDEGDVLTINTDPFPSRGVPGYGVLLNGTANRLPLLGVLGGWPRVPPGGVGSYVLRTTDTTGAELTVHLRPANI